jgi:DNA-binding transcriptional LysR family regulator
MVLTAEGREAAATAQGIEGSLRELVERIGGETARPAGKVRVSTTDAVAHFLLCRLQDLRSTYPQILLEVMEDNARVDLARGEADIAVRLGRDTPSSLIARKLGEIGWGLYASEAYLARRGAPRGVTDLSGHDIVGYAPPSAMVPGARWLEAQAPGANIAVRGGSPRAVALAVADGYGISAIPCFLAPDLPTLRRLVPDVLVSTEAFAVVSADRRGTARVRVVIDELALLFARHRGLLSGKADPLPCGARD